MKKQTKTKTERRHQVIQEILQIKKIKNQKDLLLELEDNGTKIAQSTISKDMKYMGIDPFPESGYLELAESFKKKTHIEELYTLAVDSYPTGGIFNKVDIHYLESPKGKAQEIAFHLKEAFPTIILKTIVDMTSVLVIADSEELTKKNSEADNYKEFFQL